MHVSSSPNRPKSADRLRLVDLARWLGFHAILIFHAIYLLWGPDQIVSPFASGAGLWLETFARFFATSGFTVMFFSFLLLGLKDKKIWRSKLLGVSVFGIFLWQATVGQSGEWWDIYPFLLTTFALLALVQRLGFPMHAVIWVSIVVLGIPWWELEKLGLPYSVSSALLGACDGRRLSGEWPLLPWLAWPVLAFSVGRYASNHRKRFAEMPRREGVAWFAALAASLPFFGTYSSTPLGDAFGCYTFRQPALYFAAEMTWIFFLTRLSMVERINSTLGKVRWVNWFSQRQVNQRFFLVYLLHIPILNAICGLALRSQMNLELAFPGIVILSAILAELTPHLLLRTSEILKLKELEVLWPRRIKER